MSPKSKSNIWRRLHVFLAVSLAVFLLSVTAVGFAFHGFRMGSAATASSSSADSETLAANADVDRAADGYKQAREKTLAKLSQYETANVRLQDFLDEHFADLARTVEQVKRAESPAAAPQQPMMPQAVPAAQTADNPQLKELNDNLADLKNRRSTLLKTMQPDHPAIQSIDLSIADVNSQIAKLTAVLKVLPREVPAANEAGTPSEQIAQNPSISASMQEPLPALPSAWSQADSEYRNLTDKMSAAQTDCRAAMAHQNAAWREKTRAEIDRASVLAMAARPTPQVGADLRHTIFGCASLAILLGGVVALGARKPEAVFQTAAQVRQELGLTILGILPLAPHQSPREKPRREPGWIRRSVLAAEFCLAAMVVVLAVAALNDKQFLVKLLADPLAACSQKFFC